ncbi:MAG: hypothetical protein U0175_08855 [Caldilineaceae bacterium]
MSQQSTVSKRRQSLQGYIQKVIQHIHANPTTHRSATLRALLECLAEFSNQQINFFEDLYDGPHASHLREIHPAEYVLNTTLQQVGFDLDVIVRAYSQRAMNLGDPNQDDGSQVYLKLADYWTYWALKPVMKWGDSGQSEQPLVDESTVMTYFQKSTNVRLIPYAPAVLIGIPFSAIDNSFDLLAIPHEVGHYIYHNGTWQGQCVEAWLQQQLQASGLPEWAEHWAEECFADVYGCLIAGKHIADSALEMARNASFSEYFEDDGEHPIPALRPGIYLAVLEKLSGLDWETIEEFRAAWEVLRRERPNQSLFKPVVVAASGTARIIIAAEEIEAALRQIVDTIFALPPLRRLAQCRSRSTQGLWAYSLQEMEGAALDWSVEGSLPELTSNGEHLAISTDQAPITIRPIGTTPHDQLRTQLTTELEKHSSQPVPSDAVKCAFNHAIDFRGWTVKGPIGRTH